jgi:hypothetical protein
MSHDEGSVPPDRPDTCLYGYEEAEHDRLMEPFRRVRKEIRRTIPAERSQTKRAGRGPRRSIIVVKKS